MKTYVVMPHYIINKEVLELAIGAIDSFNRTSDCIIVSCDDGSPYKNNIEDLSDIYLKGENKGFAYNCNRGFRWILENEKEECNVVCANNDIEVYPGWFEEMEKILSHTKSRIVGGLGYKDPTAKMFSQRVYSEGGRLEDWLFPGGFYMVRKSVLEDYGLYDEGFEHGGYEDIDLFYRWQKGGEKMIITPKVKYWHAEGATRFSDEEKGRQAKAESKNKEYFKQKNGFYAHEEINNIFTYKKLWMD